MVLLAGDAVPPGLLPQLLCVVQNSVVQSIPNNANTAATFNTDVYDPLNMHNTAANQTRVVVPWSGWYICQGVIGWANNATGTRRAAIFVNGTIVTGAQISLSTINDGISIPIPAVPALLTAGQFIEVHIFQNSGGALDTSAGTSNRPTLAVHYLGEG